ncbi:16S rRNA (guanine(527)-N(7))-methyltransferase RsmG [Granulosicoccaceae sp. 1_MG-2023]|nr:16S rRNA (guanine(527)-N(7))-methyltransferase RsmG [Granulosicoccaceae sp. 1_MG-2023]
MALATRLDEGLAYQQINLDDAQRASLLDFVGLLDKWNKVYNLTAVRDPLQMVSRHILDSLTLAPALQNHAVIADLGSGGGLPGIPMAVMYPDKDFTLVDSNQKKTRFLVHTVTTLGLTNVRVLHERVENVQLEAPADCVTARAFAAPQAILDYADPLCKAAAEVVLMVGKPEQLDLSPAKGFHWQSTVPVQVYNESASRHIVRFARTARA